MVITCVAKLITKPKRKGSVWRVKSTHQMLWQPGWSLWSPVWSWSEWGRSGRHWLWRTGNGRWAARAGSHQLTTCLWLQYRKTEDVQQYKSVGEVNDHVWVLSWGQTLCSCHFTRCHQKFSRLSLYHGNEHVAAASNNFYKHVFQHGPENCDYSHKLETKFQFREQKYMADSHI